MTRTSAHHAADNESLQTDVMRFMAIIAFCLIAILALVRNDDASNRPAENNPEVQIARTEPATMTIPRKVLQALPHGIPETKPAAEPIPVPEPTPSPTPIREPAPIVVEAAPAVTPPPPPPAPVSPLEPRPPLFARASPQQPG
ncbi:MAG: hypothetical protein O7H39_16530, partial [Gammaproteobacteria bacterium]|nr:hypothetical protein [Gammaproteobacteria bacterium]